MSMQHPARAFGLPLEQSCKQQVQPEKKKKEQFSYDKWNSEEHQAIHIQQGSIFWQNEQKENITLILPFLPS